MKRKITTDEYVINPLYDGIIGLDNRVRITNTTDSPYRNICCLEITFPSGKTYMSSGVLSVVARNGLISLITMEIGPLWI